VSKVPMFYTLMPTLCLLALQPRVCACVCPLFFLCVCVCCCVFALTGRIRAIPVFGTAKISFSHSSQLFITTSFGERIHDGNRMELNDIGYINICRTQSAGSRRLLLSYITSCRYCVDVRSSL
jgi:hypothetical protein